jgi:hypothetical protein
MAVAFAPKHFAKGSHYELHESDADGEEIGLEIRLMQRSKNFEKILREIGTI